jgi:hypothetical protein
VSPSTRQFVWQDRDTAASDLLQVAYFAPESIRRRALQLLQAFRSPIILPELEQIVMDEERNIWERRYALRAIAATPGDIYVPHFARFELGEEFTIHNKLSFGELIGLVKNHPSNTEWLFQKIEQLIPKVRVRVLGDLTSYGGKGESLNSLLCQKIFEVIDQNPSLLSLELVDTLYHQDGTDSTLRWLNERRDTLFYLCLTGKAGQVFGLLEDWDELREAVFKNCPSIIEEYNKTKEEIELRRLQHRPAFVDYQSSPIWQELNGWYQAALEGDRQAYAKLAQVVYHEQSNLCKRAVATNLLGKLKSKYDVRHPLIHALRYAPDDAQYEHLAMDASVRFEAGEALRDIPSPDVWESMVDAFFIRPRNVLETFMSYWIEYLTDRLSGLNVAYSGSIYGDENKRFWFRALVDENSGQENKT